MRLPEPLEPSIAGLVVDRRFGDHLRAGLDRVVDRGADGAGGTVDVFECRRHLLLRPLVVPQGLHVQQAASEAAVAAECEVQSLQPRPNRISWARLLKRVFDILSALSGRTHRVLMAMALWDGRRTHAALSRSHVRFAELTPEVIDSYVASREPFGKAGAYAIQSALAGWIEHIEGSYSGIMGLPLFETRAPLARCGAAVLPAPAAA
jgi:hypothetical protein